MNPVDSSDLDSVEPFPLPEHHDTDKSELSPEDISMDEHEAAKETRKAQLETMDEKTLLVSLHLRLDDFDAWRAKTDKRLEVGDKEFKEQKKDILLVCSSVKALCEVRGLEDKVVDLGRRISERFEPNGAGIEHDTPTNPSHERPEPDAE